MKKKLYCESAGTPVTDLKPGLPADLPNDGLSEALFRGLYDHMTSGAAIYQVLNDGSKGSDYIVKSFNRASLNMEGKTLAEVVGRSLCDLRPNIDAYGLIPVMKKVWDTGEPAFYPVKIYRDDRFANYYENHIFKIPSGDVVTIYNDVTEQQLTAEAQRESELRFRSLFENAPVGVFYSTIDGKMVRVNAEFARIMGYASPEELKATVNQTSVAEALYTDPSARSVLVQQAQVSVGNWIKAERCYRRKDGNLVLANLMFRALPGTPDMLEGFVEDITERKQIEAVQVFLAQYSSMTTGEEFFAALARYLAENLGMDFICIDRLEGDGLSARTVAVWCDGKFEDNVAYALKDTPCGEVVGKTVCCYPASVCQFFPRDTVLQDLRAESYIGVTLWSYTGQPIGLIAVIGRRPLANRPLAETILKLVAVRAAGELEHKVAEEALLKERRLLRTVIDNLPDAIYTKDLEGRKTLANRRDLNNIGAGVEADVLGKTDADLFSPEVATRLLADDLAVTRTGQPLLNREELLVDANGRRRWLLTSKIPLKDAADQVVGLVGIGHDITERKQAELEREALETHLRQAQKLEAVGQLAGGVAHDFNNKLQVILGCAEMIKAALPKNDPLQGDIADIQDAAKHSARLTKQLLAFSRRQAIAPVAMDLNAAIPGSLKILNRMIGENIRLIFTLQPTLGQVFLDPTQLDQILTNLAVNARDAIAGTGQIAITARNVLLSEAECQDRTDFVPPGDYVALTVQDDGPGMAPEIQEHIFEPFFTTKPLGEGTGLGLATVYGIVKQNNGAITVHSVMGQGTSFTIYLPRLASSALPVAEVPPEPMPTGTETVLIVEDEVAVLNLAQRTLARSGYMVLTAATPAVALSLCAQYSGVIHLLLTDVIMPDQGGKELSARIRLLRPDIRVLYMSGYPAEIMEKHGQLEVGKQVLAKPFTMRALTQQVRAVLDERLKSDG